MDTTIFIERISTSELPFVYHGEKLNDEKCQNVLTKINPEGTILGVILCDGLSGSGGLAVTDKGVWFSLGTGVMDGFPKIKGSFPFSNFIIHSVFVKKGLLPKFDIEWSVWNIEKKKSAMFTFALPEEDFDFNDSNKSEIEEIFKTLVSTTGTEYVETPYEKSTDGEKDPNTFDFVNGNIHTILTLDEEKVTIKKYKVDEKTKIQTPKGTPIIVQRNAIGSIKLKRIFDPSSLLGLLAAGVGISFFIGGLITILIFGALGLISVIFSFPQTMVLCRKDGTKIKTGIFANDEEYDRLINTLFK